MLLLIGLNELIVNGMIDSRVNNNNNNNNRNNFNEGEEKINLNSIGDWGDKDVIDYKISKWITEKYVDGILMLGDNFYPIGVKNEYDVQFKNIFQNGFRDLENDDKKIDYYVIAGNHDYYGNVTAELAYAKNNKHWNFPSLYYTKMFKSKSSKVKVFVVATDSWGLNGGDTILSYNPETGKTYIRSESILEEKVASGDVLPSVAELLKRKYTTQPKGLRSERKFDEVQYKWIEDQLSSDEAQSADWLIVLGHFPIYSCSKNEHGDTEHLIQRLLPLFEKYNVDAYLTGHDHILQHSKVGDINYFGSGAGGKKHKEIDSNHIGFISATTDTFGYMEHEFTSSYFSTTIFANIEGEKKQTHHYVIPKKTSRTKIIISETK